MGVSRSGRGSRVRSGGHAAVVTGRLSWTSGIACSAWWSVSGPRASDTNASMPWVSASRPLAALSHSGIVTSSRGSTTDTSGTSARPMMVISVRRRVSVKVQDCERSAPVPDVLGNMISGGIGCSMR